MCIDNTHAHTCANTNIQTTIIPANTHILLYINICNNTNFSLLQLIFGYKLLHTHTRTHAHTHARTHTHIHIHMHHNSQSYVVRV